MPNTHGIIGISFLLYTDYICGLDYWTRRFSAQCTVFLEVALVEEAICYLFEWHKFHLLRAGGQLVSQVWKIYHYREVQ